MTLYWMRVLCGLVWAGMAIALFPSFLRLLRGGHSAIDEWRSAFFFTAVLLSGTFTGRIFSPEQEILFVGLNALTLAVAIYVCALLREGRSR